MKSYISRFITISLHIVLTTTLGSISMTSFALESMDDDELSLTSGEGIGAIVDNLSIHSADKGSGDADEFTITLNLNEAATNKFIFSELRIHKTGTVSGSELSGGNFGTVGNPVRMGDLQPLDVFSGTANDKASKETTTVTSMRSEFPGASINQINRNSDFQINNPTGYANSNAAFQTALDGVSDKFDFHLRFDDVIAGVNSGNENFRAIIDVEGFRFYGTSSDLFATAGNGISLAGATGVYIDSLVLSSEVNAVPSSQITFNGIDIYTTLGTKSQPMTLKSVKDDNGNNQLQIEVAPLPAYLGVAPKSNIYVKSIYFGDKNSEDLRTGVKDSSKGVNDPERYHYAFQPDVGNVIEIIGMSIQHLKITTMDL